MSSTAPFTAPPTQTPPAPSGPPAPAGGWQRPPAPVRPVPHRRRPALISLGMLLVLVCAALGGWLYLRVSASSEVIAVARPVPQGQAITRADLEVVKARVPSEVKAVPRSRGRLVLGQTALVPLVKGSLLTEGQFGPGSALQVGTAVVGLALKPGQLPASGLDPGDLVAVVVAPTGPGNGATSQSTALGDGAIADDARILNVQPSASSDSVLVDLLVHRGEAVAVARAQAAGQASIFLVPSR